MSRKDSTFSTSVYRWRSCNFTNYSDISYEDTTELESTVYQCDDSNQANFLFGYYFMTVTMLIAWFVSIV